MPTKKTASVKKRSAKATKPRNSNGKTAAQTRSKHGNGAPAEALQRPSRSEKGRMREEIRQKEELLQQGQLRIAALEVELTDARRSDRPVVVVEQELRELQARFTTRQAELEAARAETNALREAASKKRGPGETLRCPRCGGKMTEQLLEQVRADRCDSCHGIFFDNGELEHVIKHHDEQKAKGQRGWFSGIFGKKS